MTPTPGSRSRRAGLAWTTSRSGWPDGQISMPGPPGSTSSASSTPGVIDAENPIPYSVVVFRDPDNIQLELFHVAA